MRSIRSGSTAVAGFLLGAALIAALTWPRLHRRYTARLAFADLGETLGWRDGAEVAASAPVTCWGDSLTAGTSASPGYDYPSVLRVVFHRQAINRGVSGETSAQVKARMLARDDPHAPANAVIWVGRNDPHETPDATLRNVADMVGSLPPGSHYLVLGVLNEDAARERRGGDWYAAIVALNRALAAAHGRHYLPIRERLVAEADAANVDDQEAAEADVVPPSLRTDALHLNERGEAFVAYAVESAIRRGEW